ncbi:alpha-amylase family glycosyl hydrolase [uncultured Acetobacteroides sp.]|uniref:alpha-amylase family glycosyl hydrolase n=1 Tax=uncultured Acetobacteroides sp. TaxID=1760811 RepID=UPI0029F53E61|nr:alpha-amylase family glycosyl hydrolase [uncultured Acetobacteroides sp.]
MKTRILILALFAVILASCSKKDDSVTPTPPDSGTEVGFQQRTWDGQNRGDVFYEIFVRSFADGNGDGIGDFKGITEKLAYLHSLGISGIWLTPMNPSPSYHGYDVTDYKATNPQFGTMADFEALLAEAKRQNIKVIIDFVINHTSSQHPWFVDAKSSPTSAHRSWYLFAPTGSIQEWISSGKVPTVSTYNASEWHSNGDGYSYYNAFWDQMPDLNLANPDVVNAINDAAKFWLDKGVDGFRLDAVKHAWQDPKAADGYAFWKSFANTMKAYKPSVYLVGEVLDDAPVVAPYFGSLPALFNFKAYWKLTEFLNTTTYAKWYPKDFQDILNSYNGYSSTYTNATKLSNHDEDRVLSTLGSVMGRAKVAAAVLLTMPGQPYIYYGEEIGMKGLKASGDENVREPFLWMLGTDTYRTTWRTPTFSTNATVTPLAQQQGDATSIYAMYKKFLELRNTYPALASGTLAYGDIDSQPDNELVYYLRQKDGEKLLVMHNFGSTSKTVSLATIVKALNLSGIKAPVAQQGGAKVTLSGSTYTVTLPEYSSIVAEMN